MVRGHIMRHLIFFLGFSAILLSLQISTFAQVDVLTRQYGNQRLGANLSETVLNPQSVASGHFGKLFELPVDEKVEAQPLVVTGVPIAGKGTRDVVYIATMNNSVFAFDCHTGVLLWKSVQLAQPIVSDRSFDTWLTNSMWGILSTPVISPKRDAMYLVTWGNEGGNKVYRLHVIDIRTGSEMLTRIDPVSHQRVPSPILIAGKVGYAGDDGKPATLLFDGNQEKQRAGLLLDPAVPSPGHPSVLYIAYCATTETVTPTTKSQDISHGWVFAYDVDHLADKTIAGQPAVWCDTPRTNLGGIWQAGSALASDLDGNVFALTGNGPYDGVSEFGESFVKLRYRPGEISRNLVPRLEVVDWCTPFQDSQRDSANKDQDLGSAGPLVIPDKDLVVGGGKDGILYVVNANNLGHAAPAAPANYFQTPFVASYTPATGTDPVKALDTAPPDFRTHHIHGAPVFWANTTGGGYLYLQGENEMVRAYKWRDNGFQPAAIAPEAERASRLVPAGTGPTDIKGGMPGGMLSLSASGDEIDTGVVWVTAPNTGDANTGRDVDANGHYGTTPNHVVAGILRAYDAGRFDTSGTGTPELHLLWDSEANHNRDSYGGFSKFCPPTIANGEVFVPTFSNKVVVYGLSTSP